MSTPETLLLDAGLAALEARLLLCHATGLSRVELIVRGTTPLPVEQVEAFYELVRRRREGVPVAYLLGVREFYGRSFRVAPGVLIPRPETELLIACGLRALRGKPRARILDLGSGSGCIALTLALEVPDAQVTGVDISPVALSIAETNTRALHATVRWVESDWYAALGDSQFDLIVANPPYIALADPHLSQGDLRFEPRLALTDQADGRSALKAVIQGARAHLAAGGSLFVEHGYDQAAWVRAELAAAGWSAIQSFRDLAGIERVSGVPGDADWTGFLPA